jgi:catechol 2,3-dioxygenase-like lactoylglutathione lyase family enzyme
MLSDQIAYVALVSADPAATSSVFERQLGLPRNDLAAPGGATAVFSIGRSALAVVPPGHALVDGEMKPGVHHIGLGVDDLAGAVARAAAAGIAAGAPSTGLAGRRCVALDRAAMAGVRTVLTERLDVRKHGRGPIERIDHIGVASADVFEDERVFTGKLGFPVESRQTDMEVSMAVESFTSDKYGVVYHTRAPEPVGGLRVYFITVGECELEFLANFDPRQGAHARERGQPGNTRQDQGAIARFVKSRGEGLHHIALKVTDIAATLTAMAEAGLPMIDLKGRPGSRRALIGFPHPTALGGVVMHLVQREA